MILIINIYQCDKQCILYLGHVSELCFGGFLERFKYMFSV